MATFDDAIGTVLQHEGGFVDNRNDPGGATNFGISLRFLQTIDSSADYNTIRNMSRDDAIEIYRNHYWNNNYDNLDSQEIATKSFDMCVNMGTETAQKIVQEAANTCGCSLVEDGDLGPVSIQAINGVDADQLLSSIRDKCWEHYQDLINHNPKFEVFAEGWKNRAYS